MQTSAVSNDLHIMGKIREAKPYAESADYAEQTIRAVTRGNHVHEGAAHTLENGYLAGMASPCVRVADPCMQMGGDVLAAERTLF